MALRVTVTMNFPRLLILLFSLSQLLPTALLAQWSTDPSNNLIVGFGLLPELASDSAGGCYITYEQNLSYPRRLMLERLNRYGYKPWGTNRRILGEFPEQSYAKLIEDGQGGVIVSYLDRWADIWLQPIIRLRVQRVDSSGTFLWGSTGVRVSLSETYQVDQAIVSDGVGGCIVAWKDTLDMIRAQRFSALGVRVWGDSGLFLGISSERILLSRSNQFGTVALYYSNSQFITQRISESGQFLWGNGIRIHTGARIMQTDESAYAYLFGGKSLGVRNGQALFTLNLQKVDTSGALLWDSLGVTLDTLNTNSFIQIDFTVQAGHSTISWPQHIGGQWDLRIQTVRPDASTIFPFGGQHIGRVTHSQSLVSVLPSDSMSAVFVWFDNRTPSGVYAQRLDTLGMAKWDTNDVALCLISLGGLKVTTDTYGGCILVGWRESDFTVRAQQVSKNGNLGEVITSIGDEITTSLPGEFLLAQNYPNPFNSATNIQYTLPTSSWVNISLYNMLGQRLITLVNSYHLPGRYTAYFHTDGFPSGAYYYRMQTQSAMHTRKLIIIK